MQLAYTHENRFLVLNMQNVLINADIEVLLKNEFAVGGAGDLAPIDSWLELWVINSDDLVRAKQLISVTLAQQLTDDWICQNCQEKNAQSFETCWQCATERTEAFV